MYNSDNKKCCFTGHRPEKLTFSEEEIKERLKHEIERSIASGFKTFITGMARGSDLWAAEIVLKEKEKDRGIRMICAVPYPGVNDKWGVKWKEKFDKVLNAADEVVYVSVAYSTRCYQTRNEWMVNNSEKVIAVFSGARGGTFNTVKYAVKNGICVVNVLE